METSAVGPRLLRLLPTLEPVRGRRPSSGPAPPPPRGPTGIVVLDLGANLRSVLITCGTGGTNYSSQHASRGELPVVLFFFPFQAPGKSDCEVRLLLCFLASVLSCEQGLVLAPVVSQRSCSDRQLTPAKKHRLCVCGGVVRIK